MHQSQSQPVDVAIVGGGPAGLTAALWLARYLRSVVLVDSGDPRNWETRCVNGFLGLPRVSPAELRGRGRDEIRRYDNTTLLDDTVIEIERVDDDCFHLELKSGARVEARRLLLAYGLRDVWPQVEGLEQIYGDTAHVCPDCDGYEARDRKTIVLGKGRRVAGMALKLTTWTPDVTICTNGEPPDLDDESREKLDALGIRVIDAPIIRLDQRAGDVHALELQGGVSLACERVFFSIGQEPADDLGAQLGCKRDEHGQIKTDEHRHTSVRQVWAAGDILPGPQLAIAAAADGATAALSIHKSLVPEGQRLD
jgi:thioredoxin reductase